METASVHVDQGRKALKQAVSIKRSTNKVNLIFHLSCIGHSCVQVKSPHLSVRLDIIIYSVDFVFVNFSATPTYSHFVVIVICIKCGLAGMHPFND